MVRQSADCPMRGLLAQLLDLRQIGDYLHFMQHRVSDRNGWDLRCIASWVPLYLQGMHWSHTHGLHGLY